MNFIAKGLGVIDSAPSGGFTKATIKARLLASFVRKETKVKAWETQHFKTDKEKIHFTQTLLKEHVWKWWMSQKQKTLDLFETLIQEEFKLWLDGRFMLHHLVHRDGMEFLELTQGDNKGSLTTYVQDFSRMLTMVPLKDEYAQKLIFLHGFKPWVWKIVYQKTDILETWQGLMKIVECMKDETLARPKGETSSGVT
ncbi:unnamed protein product [Sphagnum balticum]